MSRLLLAIATLPLIGTSLLAAEKSWVFSPPRRPAVPEVADPSSSVRNAVDSFVLTRLQEKGLTLSREAERATLLRRVTFDLTGLPPTPAELAALRDPAPAWYEKVVDRLLASP